MIKYAELREKISARDGERYRINRLLYRKPRYVAELDKWVADSGYNLKITIRLDSVWDQGIFRSAQHNDFHLLEKVIKHLSVDLCNHIYVNGYDNDQVYQFIGFPEGDNKLNTIIRDPHFHIEIKLDWNEDFFPPFADDFIKWFLDKKSRKMRLKFDYKPGLITKAARAAKYDTKHQLCPRWESIVTWRAKRD